MCDIISAWRVSFQIDRSHKSHTTLDKSPQCTILQQVYCQDISRAANQIVASQFTGKSTVNSTARSSQKRRKYQSSALLGHCKDYRCTGHLWCSPVDSPPKGPVMQKVSPYHDVIMWRICASLKSRRWVCEKPLNPVWEVSKFYKMRLIFSNRTKTIHRCVSARNT